MARAATTTAVTLLSWWALLFALYLVCVSTVSPAEFAVGGGAALLGAVAAEAVRRAERPPAGGARRLGGAGAAFPAALAGETVRLAAAVVRTLRGRPDTGREVTVRLEPGAGPALAAALLSASPGACVIDIQEAGEDAGEPGAGALLTVHLLDAAPSPVEAALPGRRER
ncbi:Multisubunit Na+/H+ antiporter, MnhE subunit [Actinacidiphila alni]|uniref:Multisubunit Na+/H+ antiporter, MnhE subunit n=1 Tax=Actinacidiphila alni TaxID=380248 RepID=A0A1I2HA28_9ACTN|nr:Na+/H+ antiporter subunit E [Actinacidiphila alni]SFF27075.1 Multisubunit Na+/H+ antiporter, MnhE subunit [Actinacidiphila alni]